jgi:hypothetical protein
MSWSRRVWGGLILGLVVVGFPSEVAEANLAAVDRRRFPIMGLPSICRVNAYKNVRNSTEKDQEKCVVSREKKRNTSALMDIQFNRQNQKS